MTDNQLEFHLPAPPVSGDTPLIPARMVNEFVLPAACLSHVDAGRVGGDG